MDIPEKKRLALRTVARFRHFGMAAAHLGVSQPTVSRQIQDIELQLKVRLFERHTRSVELTPLGRDVLNHVIQMDDLQARFANRLEMRKSGKQGHVRIASLPTLIGTVIAPFLAEMQATVPDIRIDILDLPSHGIRSSLQKDLVDLGVDNPPSQTPEGFVTEFLLEDPLCVVIGQAHEFAGRTEIAITELDRTDLVFPGAESGLRKVIEQSFARHEISARPRYAFNQVLSMLGVLQQGLGCAILPMSVIDSLPPFCRAIPLSGTEIRRIMLIRKSGKFADPVIREVAERLTLFTRG